jgi:hypothetical protein
MCVRTIVFLGCLTLVGDLAHAQIVPARFEVGGAGGAVAVGGDTSLVLLVGPRLTFNVTPRDAIELVTEVIGPVENAGLYGLYFLQYKRGLGDRALRRNQLFVTLAAGGTFEYEHIREYRVERPDLSIFVSPAYTHASLSTPFFGAAGIGFERVLRRFVSIRSDVQALGFQGGLVGIRGAVGVSVPIGGYREP